MIEIYDERDDLKVFSTERNVLAIVSEDDKELKSRNFKNKEELREWKEKIEAHKERHSKISTRSFLNFGSEHGEFKTTMGPDLDLIEFLEKTAIPSLKSEDQSSNGGDN